MNRLKKRAVAFLIDVLIFGVYFTFLQNTFDGREFRFRSLWYFVTLLPFFFKDVVFRNASIGKKIMGIAIYDKNGNAPSFPLLVKRAFFMTITGYTLFWKALFINGDYSTLVEWEEKRFGTKVVEKNLQS